MKEKGGVSSLEMVACVVPVVGSTPHVLCTAQRNQEHHSCTAQAGLHAIGCTAQATCMPGPLPGIAPRDGSSATPAPRKETVHVVKYASLTGCTAQAPRMHHIPPRDVVKVLLHRARDASAAATAQAVLHKNDWCSWSNPPPAGAYRMRPNHATAAPEPAHRGSTPQSNVCDCFL